MYGWARGGWRKDDRLLVFGIRSALTAALRNFRATSRIIPDHPHGDPTISCSPFPHRMAHSDATPSEPQNNAGNAQPAERGKRKAERPARGSSEAKRLRYVGTACDECKRRKIKCNGHMPCRRCRNLSLTCIYAQKVTEISLKEASDFQRLSATVSSLRDELENVKAELSRLCQKQQTASAADALIAVHNGPPANSDTWICPPLPTSQAATGTRRAIEQFHGPTSSIYGFNIAKSSLQSMGIDHDPVEEDETLTFGSRSRSKTAGSERATNKPFEDPIWTIVHADAVRLAELCHQECGIMYPITDVEPTMTHINWLYDAPEARNQDIDQFDTAQKELTEIVKLLIAIGLLLEGDGTSDTAQRLFQSMEATISAKLLSSPSVHSLILLVLSATFLFHSDEEGQAWRLVGVSARLCYEMGLHQRESLFKNFKNPADLRNAVRAFWIIYGLDRRWSFGTGMPFALQDADIDPLLPEPDDSSPYLKCITRCNKIMSKVWSFNLSYDPTKDSQPTEIEFLDYQVQKWYQELPETLKYDRNTVLDEITPWTLLKLRVMVALRANLATIQIYRPILHSATSTLRNISHARRVVSVAKETISLLMHINQTSNLYASQQVSYNYFLVQALAVIFLATSHAPAEFLNQTRKEFYDAIGLIRGFGENSYISKRLWSTIRDLKDLREKIGALGHGGRCISVSHPVLPSPESNAAAPEMPVSPMATPLAHVGAGQQMSNELLCLFEQLGQGRVGQGALNQPHDVRNKDREHIGSGVSDDLRGQANATPDDSGLQHDLPVLPGASSVLDVGWDMMGHSEEQNMFSRIWGELL